MYPLDVFALFPPFPMENTVFVAMSFAEQFTPRWKNVIQPAIRKVSINNTPMEPYRVDVRKVSDSILTEILTGISHSRLILADITTIGHVDGTPVRNANVMYEVGLAHARRLSQEVIIFRSDKDALLFDIGDVRVNQYDPDGNPEAAIDAVSSAVFEAFREINNSRQLAVDRAMARLDVPCIMTLMDAVPSGSILHPVVRSPEDALIQGQRLHAIQRLLELDLLEAKPTPIKAESLAEMVRRGREGPASYAVTTFGWAVVGKIGERWAGGDVEGTSQLLESLGFPRPEIKRKSL